MSTRAVSRRLPRTRESARRLGLVTVKQMIDTMALAVERPASGVRVLEVPQIREACPIGPPAGAGK